MNDNGFSLEFVDRAENGIDCISADRKGGGRTCATIRMDGKQVSGNIGCFCLKWFYPSLYLLIDIFRKDSTMGWQTKPGRSFFFEISFCDSDKGIKLFDLVEMDLMTRKLSNILSTIDHCKNHMTNTRYHRTSAGTFVWFSKVPFNL